MDLEGCDDRPTGIKCKDVYIPIEDFKCINFYSVPSMKKFPFPGHPFSYQIEYFKRGDIVLKDGTKVEFLDTDDLKFKFEK